MKTYKFPAKKLWNDILQRPCLEQQMLDDLVSEVFSEVWQRGDQALLEYTSKFDGIQISGTEAGEDEIKSSAKRITPALKAAIDRASANIRKFHKSQIVDTPVVETSPGVSCWQKSLPIDKVGLYIPGGTAPLFSTVLMLAIPATIAGCKEIVLCTPPQKDGSVHPAILYCANISGISRVYKVGGIQAIAAMTYGTETIPAVYKLFGPGNQYVTAAKQMAQRLGVAVDLPAGPSEVMIIADETCNPSFVACDLLSQAEHGEDSQVILLTTSEVILNSVLAEVQARVRTLPRRKIAEACLENSRAVLLTNLGDMVEMSNLYGPEHLILSVKNPEKAAGMISNAGSVFLGNYSPESAGDYASGTNHTLPTNGASRAYSGVNMDSFYKKITFQQLTRQGLVNLGPDVVAMAQEEKLEAHAQAITVRLQKKEK